MRTKLSSKKIIIFIAILLGFFVIFFVPPVRSTEVTLMAYGNKNELSRGGEVWLQDIIVNGGKTRLENYDIPENSGWKHINDNIVYVNDGLNNNHNLTLQFINASSVELVFTKHDWSGLVGIQDGDDYIEYDLYGNSKITYEVRNLLPLDYSWVKCLLGMCTIFLMSYFLKMLYSDILRCQKNDWIFIIFNYLVQLILLNFSLKNLFFAGVLLITDIYILHSKKKSEKNYLILWLIINMCWGYQMLYLKNPYLIEPGLVGIVLLGLYFVSIFDDLDDIKGVRYSGFIMIPVLCFIMIEIVSNVQMDALTWKSVFLNIVILTLLLIGVGGAFTYRNLGLYLFPIGLFIISTVNYYVIQFKKFALIPSDILQIRTAAAVAGDYKYNLSDSIICGFLLLALILILVYKLVPMQPFELKKCIIGKGVCFIAFSILVAWTTWIDFEKVYSVQKDPWDSTVTYSKNGFVLSFVSYLQDLYPDQPEGYSDEYAKEILARYVEKESDSNIKPTIIAIMNESFSDLEDLGDLGDAQDEMWFFNSYDKFLEKGRTYVSVRGGGTCNSEFEFLTGNSMRYFADTYPYTQYSFESVPSFVSNLKKQGYKTVAMHPENPENYKRKSVYKQMGFDEFLSVNEYEKYEKIFLNRISDLDDYKKIIEVVDSSDEPQFIFNVTIQNHGDYNAETLNKKYSLLDIDPKYNSFDDVRMFLTLMNESNKALEYLISHFENQDKPVIICFFGDHQPGCLDASFEKTLFQHDENISELANEQRYYGTPYFIWSNYENTQKTLEYATSPNYLATKVLQYAGINKTPYEMFLDEMQQAIPAINRFGYLGSDGVWYHFEEESPYKHWIEEYEILQYYNMFGDHE